MKKQMSMTRRLVFAVTGVVLVAWLLASVFSVMVMQEEFAEIFDSAVQETAERLLPLVVDDLRDRDDSPDLTQKTNGDEYLTYQVRDRDGHVILHSHDSSAAPFDVPLKVGFADTPTHKIYTAATKDGDMYIQVADAFVNRNEAIQEAGTALLFPLLLLIPASIIAVILVVRRMLAPVRDLRDEIAAKDSGNMLPIENVGLPAELDPIARSVNLLLERLKLALTAEREFASNSAHELRTPIAGALAQAQRLQVEIPAAYLPRVDQIENSLSHLAHLAEKLLQMSRADAGIGASEAVTDLMPVLLLIVRDFDRLPAGTGRIHLHAPETAKLEQAVDPDAFGIVMRNLLENALIHSPVGSKVDVFVESGRITVANDGPLIDADTLRRLTERFSRGATEATGSGLGLSIVDSLTRHMGGTLTLVSPVSGKTDGFAAEISFAP
jgi:two-component system OmpR family sensor kinase